MKCDIFKRHKDFYKSKDVSLLTFFSVIASWLFVILLAIWFLKWEEPTGFFLRFLLLSFMVSLIPVLLEAIECKMKDKKKTEKKFSMEEPNYKEISR